MGFRLLSVLKFNFSKILSGIYVFSIPNVSFMEEVVFLHTTITPLRCREQWTFKWTLEKVNNCRTNFSTKF